MEIKRKKTRQIMVGNVPIGGGAPITVQSMTNVEDGNLKATLEQAIKLAEAGCEIIRVSFPTMESTTIIPTLKRELPIPLVADVHFHAHIALNAIQYGVDKLRINPGNIGTVEEVKAIAIEAKMRGIPIRVGMNAGSLPDDIQKKYPDNVPMALKEGALRHVRILEDEDFHGIVIATKSASVTETIETYRLISKATDYPLHVGVTEAGTLHNGAIRNAIAIGILLREGIGDTIRVSLCADPIEEVRTGIEILRSLELRKGGVRVIACPTCARTQIDVMKIADEVERRTTGIKKELTVAIMGCVVNGPGEARQADIGIAGGKGQGMLFRKGEEVRVVAEKDMISVLLDEIEMSDKSNPD